MKNVRKAVAGVVAAALISLGFAGSASAVGSLPSLGIVGTGGSDTLTFNNFATPLVVTLTSTGNNVENASSWTPSGAPMFATLGFWGGVGTTTSSFTPNAIHGNYGLGTSSFSNSSSFCSNLPSTMTPGTIYDCTPIELTFDFSAPVTNPVLHVADLAGGGSDSSLWSDYALATSGLELKYLSGNGNFEVHSDKQSFGVIEHPGTGFVAGQGTSAVDILPTDAKPNAYGAGYGSIQILGKDITQLKLTVTYRYLNFDSAASNPPRTNNGGNPEGVGFNFTIPSVTANPDTQQFTKGQNYSGSAVISGNTSSNVTYSVPNQPDCGTVTMNADGSFSFAPANGSVTECVFTYQLCKTDDAGDCALADITLTTAAVNSLADTGAEPARNSDLALLLLAAGAVLLAASRRALRFARGERTRK